MILRDYQEPVADQAVELLKKYNIAYIAGQMRTGKTPVSLFVAERFGAKNVLFFSKKKALVDIQKHYDKGEFHYNFIALNYEKLKAYQDYDKEGKPLAYRCGEFHKDYLSPDLVILDEAHSLGQFPVPANKVKQIQLISLLCPVLFLSGTPTPESYSQLYHQFKVSSFSPFLSWKTFYKWASGFQVKIKCDDGSITVNNFPGFVTVKHKYLYNRQINDYSNANKEMIDSLTKHLFITMTQKDAGFEQTVEDVILTVKMKDSTVLLANKLLKDRVIRANDGSFILADTAGKMMQKIHQIMSGTVIAQVENNDQSFIENKGNHIYSPVAIDDPKTFDNSKADYIKLNFYGGETEWHAARKLAILYVYKMEYASLLFTFGADNITDNPEVFKNSGPKMVFVGQIRSTREGVDLSCADCLIMYNIEYSALSYMQGRERIQTMDRKTAAKCYWIFSEGGPEQKIYNVVRNKMDYTASHFKKDYNL